ncbi:GNAT family N-acetyltransferase [Clostridiaceae bacterium M8S5]|nr:GNAT family N-acetyltransferase [Clostridiaceae bacterium M8S5]
MIYELEKNQFDKIAHLLENELINLEVIAVARGYNPGWIFVDNIQSPKTAMIWSRGIEGFYFIGDANNTDFNSSVNDFIDKVITQRANKLGLNTFEFSGTSKEWDKTLKRVFHSRNMYESKQYVYKHNGLQECTIKEYDLTVDYIMKRVDKELLDDSNYDMSFVKDAILEWWDSFEDFLNNGVGFCIIHDNKAVCSCVTSFTDGASMESHIVTHESYRKKGLATVAVSEYLRECKIININPYWDCMQKNYGSRALAEKLGYTLSFEYALYEFDLK